MAVFPVVMEYRKPFTRDPHASITTTLEVILPPYMAIIRSERRIKREKFYKRSLSWFSKGNELAQLTEADIYMVAYRNGKYYIYKSIDRPGFPPTEEEIVNRLDRSMLCVHYAEISSNRINTILLRCIGVRQTFSP